MNSDKDTLIPYSAVCMIYSNLDLPSIEEIFRQYTTDRSQYGPIRIDRSKDENGQWRDTNRAIALISEPLFRALIDDGFHKPVRAGGRPSIDFRIVPYEVRENKLPRPGLKKDFLIRIPRDLDVTSQEVEDIIQKKMHPLVDFGVIRADQYQIKIPLKNRDRETGRVRNSVFLTFSEEVMPETAVLVKAVIDDTYWGQSNQTFHCFWAKDLNSLPPTQKPRGSSKPRPKNRVGK